MDQFEVAVNVGVRRVTITCHYSEKAKLRMS